jgi:predicted site-specific integrase-resolvase
MFSCYNSYVRTDDCSQEEEEIMNTADVARELGVTRMTVNRWVDAGALQPLPAVTEFRLRRPPLRFTRTEVERFKDVRRDQVKRTRKPRQS